MGILQVLEDSSGRSFFPVSGHWVPIQLKTPLNLKKRLKDWKLLWQRDSQNTEESQGLERRPTSDPRVKWRPLRTGPIPGPLPRRGNRCGPPGARGHSGTKRSRSLVGGPGGSPLGAASRCCSMLLPEVLFTAGRPPASLVSAVRWRLPWSAMW